MINVNKFNLNDYLGKRFLCACQREHSTDTKEVVIKPDAFSELGDLLLRRRLQKPFFVFDQTTYALAAEKIFDALNEAGTPYAYCVSDSFEPVADESFLGRLLQDFDPSCDVVCAVGCGTVGDTCRFFSHRLHLPFITLATAPSMDGFASTVAPLICGGRKVTFTAHAPLAILAEPAMLAAAPKEMLAAGAGDILGKYSCLADWRISCLVTGEYYCPKIMQMVEKSVADVNKNLSALAGGEPDAAKSLMEALVLSGVAMSFSQNSRPASGSEHHLSHFWEMMFLFEGKKPVLHGAKVGVGTVCVLAAYKRLAAEYVDFEKARQNARNFDFSLWKKQMEALYQKAAPGVIALEEETGKNAPEAVTGRIDALCRHWDEVLAIIAGLPAPEAVAKSLRALGAPAVPAEIGVDKKLFCNAFVAAKELRCRYGLLQLLFDLGLLEKYALRLWDYLHTI